MTNRRVAVIDLDSVCYTIGHGNKIMLTDGSFLRDGKRLVYQDKTDAELVDSANKVMNDILRNCGATHYIGYMKGYHTTDFRKRINPEYKAQRSQEPPKWWNFVQNTLALNWQAQFVDEIEVDDAVCITTKALSDSFIVAIDGDLLGLPGTHYNWRKNEWVMVNPVEAGKKFWTDMIAGQPIDNVKGIPGKGEAFARGLFAGSICLEADVFKAYTHHFGVDAGIREFYKNYVSLRTLETYPGFVIPEPVPYIKQTEEKEIPL